jgi:crossover junction endodeoxyribonuclease RuvC
LIVAGIDPGSNATGYSFLKITGNSIIVLEYGVVRTKPSYSLPEKLKLIHDSLSHFFETYNPRDLAIETAFVAKYPQAALILGHTRGAIMVDAQTQGIKIHEYAPRVVKKSVVGSGRASKAQVASMIQKHLQLKQIPKPEDAADALAVAYCHLIRMKLL